LIHQSPFIIHHSAFTIHHFMKFNFSLLALASLCAQRALSSPACMAANEMLVTDPGFGPAKPGEFYAANEGELADARRSGNVFEAANDGNLAAGVLALSQPLSQFSTGVQDRENLQELLDRLFPLAPVGGLRFSYLAETEAEEFLYLIYGMYYRNNDKTNFTGIDIFAAIVITFFITFILSSVI
jgi:hypothetical protein